MSGYMCVESEGGGVGEPDRGHGAVAIEPSGRQAVGMRAVAAEPSGRGHEGRRGETIKL